METAFAQENGLVGTKPKWAFAGGFASDPAMERLGAGLREAVPQATVQFRFRHFSFMLGDKVFAFTRSDGLALKLPEPRVRELLEACGAEFLVMGVFAMRNWVLMRYDDVAETIAYRTLLEEAMRFVPSRPE